MTSDGATHFNITEQQTNNYDSEKNSDFPKKIRTH